VNIDWVIPCRYVEVHDQLATIIGGGIDTFWMPNIPAPLQVMLAVRLAALADELDGTEHKIVNRILDPHGDLIDESEIGLAISGEAARPEWLVGVPIPLLVQFEVAEEGTYTVELSVDDASASLPLHVVYGVPGAPGAPGAS
jgi:hypothetical protein